MIFILLSSIFHSVEGAITRKCSKQNGDGGIFFSCLISFFSMLFFLFKDLLMDSGGITIPNAMWGFGIISGLLYAGGFYYMYLALKKGSFLLVRLVATSSIIFPIIYGVVFLNESLNILGLVLLIVASLLFKINTKNNPEQNKKKSKRWLFYTILSVVCIGFISIISRIQQLHFDDAFTNEFLFISLAVSFLSLLIISIVKDRKRMKEIFKSSLLYSSVAGACNGMSNMLKMVAYIYVPISIVIPINMGLEIIISFFVSFFLYKEKFTKYQLLGVAITTVGLILLNN